MLLSVIVPTHNERENVALLVNRVEAALTGMPHEVVFVDDSDDGTEVVIAEQAKHCECITLIRRAERRGLASAVVDGIERARGEILCVLDADLQHPPEVIPALIEALAETDADLVVASRYVPGGSYQALAPFRQVASRVATLLARVLLSRARPISDPLSGFFVLRRRTVQGLSLRPRGYKLLLEILVRARLVRVIEMPYQFQVRSAGRSKLSFRQNWEYLRHLMHLATAQLGDLRFVRFCLVGGSGVLVNTAVLWLVTAAGIYYLRSSIAAVAAATTWNFLLNDRFTWWDQRSADLRTRLQRYLKYWAVTGVGGVIQVAILFVLTTAGLPYLLSNLVGIGGAVWWNLQANGRWTWKPTARRITRAIYVGREPTSAKVASH